MQENIHVFVCIAFFHQRRYAACNFKYDFRNAAGKYRINLVFYRTCALIRYLRCNRVLFFIQKIDQFRTVHIRCEKAHHVAAEAFRNNQSRVVRTVLYSLDCVLFACEDPV